METLVDEQAKPEHQSLHNPRNLDNNTTTQNTERISNEKEQKTKFQNNKNRTTEWKKQGKRQRPSQTKNPEKVPKESQYQVNPEAKSQEKQVSGLNLFTSPKLNFKEEKEKNEDKGPETAKHGKSYTQGSILPKP
ncbi:hypothetical protein Tco_1183511 [Tanacetum coccineum]